jgi:predicted helicase
MAVRNRSSYYTQILYRPFNCRHIFFHPSVVWRPRLDVMSQLQRPNVALITTRQTRDPFGALATNMIVGHKSVAAYDINSVFPLYDYPDTRTRAVGESSDRKSNFTFQFLSRVAGALHLRQDSEDGSPQGLSPEDLFNYIYAVLHSPTYRERYAEFLKIEFPRIPLIDSLDLFRALAKLGGELVTLHLMESKRLDKHTTTFVGPASPEVEKVSWAKNTVWLDKKLTRGFRGVPESVWNFHIGGYQVCEKWLKDRKGRTLSKDDLEHYHRIVVALSETIRLMAEIDKTIDAHGGWPGAFQESAAEPK